MDGGWVQSRRKRAQHSTGERLEHWTLDHWALGTGALEHPNRAGHAHQSQYSSALELRDSGLGGESSESTGLYCCLLGLAGPCWACKCLPPPATRSDHQNRHLAALVLQSILAVHGVGPGPTHAGQYRPSFRRLIGNHVKTACF
ncbi:hypothetical protein PG997_003379 [Apiospora hydei]|uniref:Uncharacterized protein n=1 Tax=Apiospora hydei TaxID=1337664 RepID=A0ABR1WZ28_9PEZI